MLLAWDGGVACSSTHPVPNQERGALRNTRSAHPSQARIVGTGQGVGGSWLQTLLAGDHGQCPPGRRLALSGLSLSSWSVGPSLCLTSDAWRLGCR